MPYHRLQPPLLSRPRHISSHAASKDKHNGEQENKEKEKEEENKLAFPHKLSFPINVAA